MAIGTHMYVAYVCHHFIVKAELFFWFVGRCCLSKNGRAERYFFDYSNIPLLKVKGRVWCHATMGKMCLTRADIFVNIMHSM